MRTGRGGSDWGLGEGERSVERSEVVGKERKGRSLFASVYFIDKISRNRPKRRDKLQSQESLAENFPSLSKARPLIDI